MNPKTQAKLRHLQQLLKEMKSCAIAYSGGVDSTFLITIAYNELGDHVIAVTATSSTYPTRELKEAEQYAKNLGIKHVVIHSEELGIDGFADNPPDRCYYCKKELFQKIQKIVKDRHLSYVLDGSNADDTRDYRPGTKAREELLFFRTCFGFHPDDHHGIFLPGFSFFLRNG